MTPTLVAVRERYPQAEIWVVVRQGTEGILRGCTAIDCVLTTAPAEKSNRSLTGIVQELNLIRTLRQQKFDHVFELSDGDRGRILACLTNSNHRCTTRVGTTIPWWARSKFDSFATHDWDLGHRVEKDFFTVQHALPLMLDAPPLHFERGRIEPWPCSLRSKEFILIHPGTRWRRKRWPIEKWMELTSALLDRVPGLIISCGPDSDEIAMAAELQKRAGERAVTTEGKLNWGQLAGLLYDAKLFVGVDTAAMHLAAACQTPTVALFGPSSTLQWRPWKVAHTLVTPELPGNQSEASLIPAEELINHIGVESVINACDQLLLATQLRARKSSHG